MALFLVLAAFAASLQPEVVKFGGQVRINNVFRFCFLVISGCCALFLESCGWVERLIFDNLLLQSIFFLNCWQPNLVFNVSWTGFKSHFGGKVIRLSVRLLSARRFP